MQENLDQLAACHFRTARIFLHNLTAINRELLIKICLQVLAIHSYLARRVHVVLSLAIPLVICCRKLLSDFTSNIHVQVMNEILETFEPCRALRLI